MVFLLIYIVVGSVSALSNLGKWLFSSWIVGMLFLPFMVVYYLIYGDAQKKKEAFSMLGLFVFYFVIVGVIMIYQKATN